MMAGMQTRAASETERLSPSVVGRLCIIALGYFTALLDLTLVNVAVPSIEAGLAIPRTEVFWVTNGFGLFMCPFMLLSPALAGRVGSKRTFQLGLLGLAVGSVVAGSAMNSMTLIFGRLIQGGFAGLMIP